MLKLPFLLKKHTNKQKTTDKKQKNKDKSGKKQKQKTSKNDNNGKQQKAKFMYCLNKKVLIL